MNPNSCVLRARRRLGLAAVAGALLSLATPLRADLPPITPADWSATPPPRDSHASALVLYKRAEFALMDLTRQQLSSSLRQEVRLKVLDRRGFERGELEIAHSNYLRLKSLTGRTRLADGRVLPLPAEAKFDRRLSKNDQVWVTAVAFPGVEVGAILEYEASFLFDSILFLEPWYLSDRAPVLYSEVVFDLPKSLQARTWGRDPFQAGVQTEKSNSQRGVRLRAWARNLPGIPAESFGAPFEDLATQFGLVTTAYSDEYQLYRLLETWQTACALIHEQEYSPARNKDRGVKQKARELAGKAATPEAKAQAIYAFVRDQLRNEEAPGVTLAVESTLEKVLADGSGDSAEKGLLLQAMLDAVGVPAKLVWANERHTGLVAMDVTSPAWFERVLVAVELGAPRGRVFLDPSERGLPFGWLPASLEGETALLFDPKKPEPVMLPSTPAAANTRKATVSMAVDDSGALTGNGELVLAGQPAIAALTDDEPLQTTWQKWLDERFPGFRIEKLQVTPTPDAAEVKVRWTATERAEEVLGDEATVALSRPLGPLAQPLALEPALRRSPVVLPYASSDEVVYEVTYPQGWRVQGEPPGAVSSNDTGSLRVDVEVDPAARKVRYRRKLDLTLRELRTPAAYEHLRSLFAAVERNDAQGLALARD